MAHHARLDVPSGAVVRRAQEGSMLRLRDIMTADLVTLTPETTLREAFEQLSAHHVSGAPVLDGSRVAGVVTASDLLAFTASVPGVPTDDAIASDEEHGAPLADDGDDPAARYYTDLWSEGGADAASRFAETRAPEWDLLAEHTVSEVMTRRVLALPSSADVSEAAERMRASEVHRVLVMDGERLVGIVTALDVARAVAEGRIARRTYVFGHPAAKPGRGRRLS
jgi:CBS domain-containing protein